MWEQKKRKRRLVQQIKDNHATFLLNNSRRKRYRVELESSVKRQDEGRH